MSASLSASQPDSGLSRTIHPDDLSIVDMAILTATTSHSLSLVAIAESVGMGSNPCEVLPVVERLEQLELLDGYFAAGRVLTASSDVHRRYYRASDFGRQFV